MVPEADTVAVAVGDMRVAGAAMVVTVVASVRLDTTVYSLR
jgi:hypothetical protein